ncbi:MAG: hypothetical protein J6I68_00835 [Butyrivibrio sp.]|uniref:DUF6273 domain-containing protein n=1 Tax=Butyrivibrio sp. TaxID=28121 RepID=UPI001B4DD5F4|nr:DUF6273 domain-containing protein [Butyrivibrio sp.]MBP3781773.1 hypothetical protein [Butyrivibrio sp.]
MSEMMYGQIMVHCATSIGSTVRFTDESGTARTGTIASNGYLSMKLAAFKRYTVTLGAFTSDPITLGAGQNVFVEAGLTTASWDGIKRIVNAGKAADYISNGDQFTVELSGGETLVYEANVNVYGLGEVDFIPTYCLATTRQHHTSNTNAGGWNASDLRTYLNNTFITMLPSDLQAVISEKPVKATQGSQVNTVLTSNDKIWIPTEKEVFGGITYSGSSENSVNNLYPIFTDAASRVRTQGSNGAAGYVWLASPYIGNSTHFCIVGTSGAPDYGGASGSYGVLPCFRIAPDA